MQHYCDKLQPTYRQLGLNVTLEDCMYGLAMVSWVVDGVACLAAAMLQSHILAATREGLLVLRRSARENTLQ